MSNLSGVWFVYKSPTGTYEIGSPIYEPDLNKIKKAGAIGIFFTEEHAEQFQYFLKGTQSIPTQES